MVGKRCEPTHIYISAFLFSLVIMRPFSLSLVFPIFYFTYPISASLPSLAGTYSSHPLPFTTICFVFVCFFQLDEFEELDLTPTALCLLFYRKSPTEQTVHVWIGKEYKFLQEEEGEEERSRQTPDSMLASARIVIDTMSAAMKQVLGLSSTTTTTAAASSSTPVTTWLVEEADKESDGFWDVFNAAVCGDNSDDDEDDDDDDD
jgi:hypothetical protein